MKKWLVGLGWLAILISAVAGTIGWSLKNWVLLALWILFFILAACLFIIGYRSEERQ